MVAGEMLDLYIRIKRLDQGNNRMIMIEIWDSGEGARNKSDSNVAAHYVSHNVHLFHRKTVC